MKEQPIDFKSTSDGWRGTIARNFTFENVGDVAQAIGQFVKNDLQENRLIVGYDTRFMGRDFALYLSTVVQSLGIDTSVFSSPTPTPVLTFATHEFGYPCGVTITASHNPYTDNGIKLRMSYGGAPFKDTIQKIESYLGSSPEKVLVLGNQREINPFQAYISKVRQMISWDVLGDKSARVLVDTMHGTTRALLREICKTSNVHVEYLHQNFDSLFGNVPPEPKYETTRALQKAVKQKEYDFGVAHDGDGDRIIAVTPNLGYLSPHDVAAMTLLYLAKYKGETGLVIGSSTLGRRVATIARNFNLRYREIPVGFRNATKIMLSEKVLLAAEENGGLGFGFYLPERDATLAAALLTEAHCVVDGGIEHLAKEVEEIAGKSGFSRFNYKPIGDRAKLMERILGAEPEQFSTKEINEISTSDGIKIFFKDGDWVSMRFSGTEDIIRIYVESDSRESAEQIVNSIAAKLKTIEEET